MKKQQELVTTLEQARIEEFVVTCHNYPGRPANDRAAISKAFVDGKVCAGLRVSQRFRERSPNFRICAWPSVRIKH